MTNPAALNAESLPETLTIAGRVLTRGPDHSGSAWWKLGDDATAWSYVEAASEHEPARRAWGCEVRIGGARVSGLADSVEQLDALVSAKLATARRAFVALGAEPARDFHEMLVRLALEAWDRVIDMSGVVTDGGARRMFAVEARERMAQAATVYGCDAASTIALSNPETFERMAAAQRARLVASDVAMLADAYVLAEDGSREEETALAALDEVCSKLGLVQAEVIGQAIQRKDGRATDDTPESVAPKRASVFPVAASEGGAS